jgi:N-acetylglutamate synthase-like GNAT family acetyltransferase
MGLDWKRFLVAVSPEEELLGCGQIKPHPDGSLELASIAVRDRARGGGIARRIIEELLVKVPQRPLYLMCRARLESLYVKFGFQSIEFQEMPRYFKTISRAERIFNKNAEPMDRLRVMRLD